MRNLVLLAAVAAVFLVPASGASADPKEPNYGHCLKLLAQGEGLTPSEFNAIFNPPKSKGDHPGAPIACLFTAG